MSVGPVDPHAMTRKASSQWSFGELFPPAATRRVLSVSDLTQQVKRLMEQQVGTVWVTGEITNLRLQSSGHCYFTLKDSSSQVACVLFRGEAVPLRDQLRDGIKAIIQGGVTVYEARGQYQIIVRSVELQGVGALQLAFERLKHKLSAEGLFAPERKKELPRFPRGIGIVTSLTGAAIEDVLHVLARRDPGLAVVLAGCRVQGDGAATEVAQSIRLLNRLAGISPGLIDLILVTRGGGSLEDLWAFNEEEVARAIAASELPVVSAVGHEIDFTISDFVADLRAATPSAAAEVITQAVFACRPFVEAAPGRMASRARRRLEAVREAGARTRAALLRRHPRRRLQEQMQRTDDLQIALVRRIRSRLHEVVLRADGATSRLRRLRPEAEIQKRWERLRPLHERLLRGIKGQLESRRNRLETMLGRLRLLSPEAVLDRGYSITMDVSTGQVVRDAAAVPQGARVLSRLRSGQLISVVESSGGSD